MRHNTLRSIIWGTSEGWVKRVQSLLIMITERKLTIIKAGRVCMEMPSVNHQRLPSFRDQTPWWGRTELMLLHISLRSLQVYYPHKRKWPNRQTHQTTTEIAMQFDPLELILFIPWGSPLPMLHFCIYIILISFSTVFFFSKKDNNNKQTNK